MAIILEGPDNSGKTTLCKDIQRMEPSVEAHHAGGRPDDRMIPTLLFTQDVMSRRDDVILDRCTAISEQVYRPGKLLDVQHMMWILNATKHPNCVVVYCKPTIDALLVRESITFRDEENEDTRARILDNLHNYVANYEAIMAKVPHIVYNYDDEVESAWMRKYIADAYRRKDFGDLQIIAHSRKVF